MNPNTTTEYRDLPLAVLTESATNPRRIFEDAALKELAESIRSQGIRRPCLCGLLPTRASRSSRERGASVPPTLPRWTRYPSASCNSPTASH